MDAPMLQPSVDTESTHSNVQSIHSMASNSSEVMQQVTELLQAQRDMMAAQIKAMMTNSLPPLRPTVRMVASRDGWNALRTEPELPAGQNSRSCFNSNHIWRRRLYTLFA
jgi:hypothetical protein